MTFPMILLHGGMNILMKHVVLICLQAALKRGALSVQEPWDETDEGGTVTFATVQTVSVFHFISVMVRLR